MEEIKESVIYIEIDNMDCLIKLHGSYDENLSVIQNELGVTITSRDTGLVIEGTEDGEKRAAAVINKIMEQLVRGESIDRGGIRYLIDLEDSGQLGDIDEIARSVVAVTAKGKPIKCRTAGQKRYVDALKKNTVVLAVGPAGTGKTYLAVCYAVSCLRRGEIEKIILTRPAVEAGEKLGFLPGDLQNKVDPYLRPLYDALSDMLGQDGYARLMEKGTIEVAPLAYMRGRTLNSAFVILDEAQNATSEQMKMFLTRLGEGSKMVVNGDVTQIDLPRDRTSGLKTAMRILEGIDKIATITLDHRDVVRHEIVQNIVRAYERAEKNQEGNK